MTDLIDASTDALMEQSVFLHHVSPALSFSVGLELATILVCRGQPLRTLCLRNGPVGRATVGVHPDGIPEHGDPVESLYHVPVL